MAELATFFDNVTYSASDMDLTLAMDYGKDGVILDYANSLAPSNPSSLTTTFDTGGVVFLGYRYRNTASKTVTSAAVTSGKMRCDLVVVRFDSVAGTGLLTIIQGTEASSNPTIPSIVGGTDVLVATLLLDNTSSLIVTLKDTRDFAKLANEMTIEGQFNYLQGAI